MTFGRKKIFYLLLLLAPLRLWADIDTSALSLSIQSEVAEWQKRRQPPLTLSDLDSLVRLLMSKGLYENVSIEQTDTTPTGVKHYTLKVVNLRKINSVEVRGNSIFSDNELLSMTGLIEGSRLDGDLLQGSSGKIKEAYQEKGYYNTSVDLLILPVKDSMDIALQLNINEGRPLQIEQITVSSENPELTAYFTKKLKKYKGELYTGLRLPEIQKQISDYLREEYYVRAEIQGPTIQLNPEKTRINLTYVIAKTEKFRFVFSGNNQVRTNLKKFLDLENFYSASPNIGPELASRVKAYYLQLGYARVDVTAEETSLKPNISSQITFFIKEGPRIKVEELVILGQLSRASSYYQKVILENSGEALQKGYYNRDQLDRGIESLTTELQNSGYLSAKTQSIRVQYNKERDRVKLFVNLSEGPKTIIRQIQFLGNRNFSHDDLLTIVDLQTGGPLLLNKLEGSLLNLTRFYQEQGYLEMSITNERANLVQYDPTTTYADLSYQIYEGPQIRVSSISIDGNGLTRDYVILKELDFAIGDLLTPNNINESYRRLQKTGLFTSIEIKTLEEKTQISDRTVLIKVSERLPKLFHLGPGITNERELTLRGFVGFANRNISGTARAFSTRADLNYNVADIKYPEIKLSVGYLEPYLLDTRTRGRGTLVLSSLVTDFDSRLISNTWQLVGTLERNISSSVLFGYDVYNRSSSRDFKYEDPAYGETTLDIVTQGPIIEVDRRDHPFNPTQGDLLRLQYEYSKPWLGSNRTIDFSRMTANYTHYLPFLKGSMVWANSLRGGYLQNTSDQADGAVPYNKKGFVLGGQSTVRGFEASTTERFPNFTDLGSDNYQLTTESGFYLLKTELRFPLLWENISGVVFYDGGGVHIQGLSFEDEYRDAAGFGIRYGTPVGPVNLEFAWKLDQKPNESPFRVHFSIGAF